MTSLASVSPDDLLAALRCQYEWGVDIAVDDTPWAPLEEMSRQLAQHTPPPPKRAVSPVREASSSFSQRNALLSAPDIETLLRVSGHIEGVSLSRTAMHRLQPVLVAHAPLMLIGEVPDADEDRSGKLFSGQAGLLLDKTLASIGVTRDEVSMAPAIPWRPPGGQRVAERDLNACLPLLQRTIALCNPRYLVTMGTTPMRLLCGSTHRLSQVRGRWTEVSIPGLAEPVPLFPMLHPLQLSGGAVFRRHFWHDLLVLTERIRQPSQ